MKSKRRNVIAGMKLKMQDVRASKVWQEAYSLGFVEGFLEGFKLGLGISRAEWQSVLARRLLAMGISAAMIAKVLEISEEQVQRCVDAGP